MNRSPEGIRPPESGVQMERSPEKTTIRGRDYVLSLPSGKQYIELYDNNANHWADFSFLGRIDSTMWQDETYSLQLPEIKMEKDCVTIRVQMDSTAWNYKEQIWTCKSDGIEVHYELMGNGNITRCEMLGGFKIGAKGGTYPSHKYFSKVFNPEPTFSEKPIRSANHPSHLNMTGAFRTGNKDGQFTPAPWYFAMQKENTQKNLSLSLAAPIEQQNFTSFDYVPYEDSFFMQLDFQGHTEVNDVFKTPSLLIRFTDDPYRGIEDYTEKLRSLNFLPTVSNNDNVEWHRRPIYCGWGAQVRAAAENPGTTPQDFSTQDFYQTRKDKLAEHGMWLPIVIVDHGWTESAGTLQPDRSKWNLTEWNEQLHSEDQKILVHYKMWDPEGVDPNLCIKGPAGEPVAVDPTHPEFSEFIRDKIQYLLSPSGYDVDGIKTDFSGDIPNGHFYRTYGRAWGAHLQHTYYKTVYDAAKQAKPDSLVITHSPNPQFADVTDMIRLNDINHHHDIKRQMQHRAKVARAAIPHALIDTDNWPIDERKKWRRYLKVQPKLGSVAFYDNHELAEKDYAMLRAAGFSR